ncbi:MAG TPA: hypothetical protein G4N97_10900, partial [Thermoflexia bacterium]|nr:hypothetical protein [Thermoflexia bacterium]
MAEADLRVQGFMDRHYRPVTATIVTRLRAIVGEGHVYDDPAALLDYAHDEV